MPEGAAIDAEVELKVCLALLQQQLCWYFLGSVIPCLVLFFPRFFVFQSKLSWNKLSLRSLVWAAEVSTSMVLTNVVSFTLNLISQTKLLKAVGSRFCESYPVFKYFGSLLDTSAGSLTQLIYLFPVVH